MCNTPNGPLHNRGELKSGRHLLGLHEGWNRGTDRDSHVGSVMLAPDLRTRDCP